MSTKPTSPFFLAEENQFSSICNHLVQCSIEYYGSLHSLLQHLLDEKYSFGLLKRERKEVRDLHQSAGTSRVHV